jgi:phage gp36-like protein
MYHTLDDLIATLSADTVTQLTDDGDISEIDTSVTDAKAAAAATTIDSYVGTRYSFPLPSVPGILKEVSLGLTVYELYFRRMGENIPKSIRERRDTAISILEHIRDGKMRLFETDKSGTMLVNKTAADRLFSRDTLARF